MSQFILKVYKDEIVPRCSRRLLLIGGTCLVGGIALAWYWRKSFKKRSKQSSSGLSDNVVEGVSRLSPGLKSSQIMKERGNEFFKAGKYQKALEAFIAAITLCPETERRHLAICHQNKAAALERMGRISECIEECSAAIKLDPHYVKPLVRRSKALLANDPEGALDDLILAVVVDQTQSAVLMKEIGNIAEIVSANFVKQLKASKKVVPIKDEAVLVWRSVYVNDPILEDLKKPILHTNSYGRALQAILDRRYEEVIPLLEEDLNSEIDDISRLRDIVFIVRFSLMKENVELAKKYLNNFEAVWSELTEEARSEIDNKRFRAIFYLLRASLRFLENNDNFLTEIESAMEVDRGNVDVYVGAALLLSENSRHELAIRILEQLAELEPKHHLVKHLKANCELAQHVASRDVNGVMVSMQKVDRLLQENPNPDPILYMITGRLYFAAQSRKLARSCFQKAAESLPDFAAPVFYLAVVEAEETEGSGEQLRNLEEKMHACIEKEEANPDAYAVLARIAFQKQDFEESIKLYEKSFSMIPPSSFEASLMPTVSDYVQTRSLLKAIKTLEEALR